MISPTRLPCDTYPILHLFSHGPIPLQPNPLYPSTHKPQLNLNQSQHSLHSILSAQSMLSGDRDRVAAFDRDRTASPLLALKPAAARGSGRGGPPSPRHNSYDDGDDDGFDVDVSVEELPAR